MLSYIGLGLIIIAWGLQFFSKTKNMRMRFILTYALGAAILAIDGYQEEAMTLAALNTISFLLAVAVFFKIRR